ncbi:MAG: hypothetical protein ACR2LY_00655 [Thermoleophilaceae bacterium]
MTWLEQIDHALREADELRGQAEEEWQEGCYGLASSLYRKAADQLERAHYLDQDRSSARVARISREEGTDAS